MPVYVDPLFETGKYWAGPRSGTQACHLRADTLEELHEFAAKIGMRPEWFQDKPGQPHYDLTETRRALAISRGAIPLSRREWAEKFSRQEKEATI